MDLCRIFAQAYPEAGIVMRQMLNFETSRVVDVLRACVETITNPPFTEARAGFVAALLKARTSRLHGGTRRPEMVEWLQYIGEPSELVLAWQAGDRTGVRFRWVKVPTVRLVRGKITSCSSFRCGCRIPDCERGTASTDEILDLGYRGYPGFRPRAGKHRDGVLASLMRRLPPRTRSDFDAYLRHFRVAPRKHLSDFALLGLTEAKLPNDGFSVVDPLHGYNPPIDLLCDVAGYRYYAGGFGSQKLAARSVIIPEPDNDARPKMRLSSRY